jgi:hypothetical protein
MSALRHTIALLWRGKSQAPLVFSKFWELVRYFTRKGRFVNLVNASSGLLL